ncbi:alpha/beta fold hydrolase [Microbacterium foliorum]|jgi:pimeloyl-ACP methyl ester carboxylesterase|uniref:Proline iminopeptidase n=1 Tax=Microbacterium foliorum TaxID=104336 RepID=A0A0F0KL66_9MICO|nr:alpha/beta fold hydrolase [Microbacterium foliorum]AXL12334.1 alpha/beta fold hydrolase [Microbacterium foliorum]KJL20011.1 Proline iminopeptidase [Microbacterium foliorum]CAH0181434.1 Proline iminopeptidase [Microbacterium foliorum]CAH0212457.1 Proline iminopeptidase [Microbacterium foliorum]
MKSTTTVHRLLDLAVEEHTLTVPLVWDDPTDTRTIEIFARVVTRDGGDSLPFLVYLQGGPGHEAPRPFHSSTAPPWLDEALAHYRVVMLDQRGTGLSTPVGDDDLAEGSAAVAEHLTHLRADAIVRDCEAMREHLGAITWSVLGQSFGGFTSLAYLSTHAASLADVFITGGLSAIGRHPDDVYALCYSKMRDASERYYRRFPEHRDRMRRLVDHADAGDIVLPDGEVVSRSRLRSVGSALGMNEGWQTLWSLLERDHRSNAFRHDLMHAMPYNGRNPLYFAFHESSYADGHATRWSAERVEPDDFREDVTLFTGEHIRREWTETVPAFRPWREVTLELAEFEWPRLYDRVAIEASGATGAAAVYTNDVYVPLEFSLETAGLLPGIDLWVTSEHEHNGLRSGPVLSRLIDLAHGRRIR